MIPAYEYFETDADIGVIGRGATAAEAFVQTALAVFALIVEPSGIEERERREVHPVRTLDGQRRHLVAIDERLGSAFA